ncbi:MAG: extensin family protein [Parvibaculaceae bacterium]
MAPPAQCLSDPRTLGNAERLDPIDEGNGCQIPNPWRMTSIAGVELSQPATINCSVAGPLSDWINNVVQPAANDAFGERVTVVGVAASYSCRPRNNQRGARMSEHGFGNAIDISSFTLESGRKVDVRGSWIKPSDENRFLSGVREEACGMFKTVLGPGSDSHHKDHLHLDLATRKSGRAYCK